MCIHYYDRLVERLTTTIDEVLVTLRSSDVTQLAITPNPKDIGLAEASLETAVIVAAESLRWTISILRGEVEFPNTITVTCTDCDYSEDFRDGKVWDRLVSTLIGYYDFAMSRILASEDVKSDWVGKTLRIDFVAQAMGSGANPLSKPRAKAQYAVSQYLECLISSYFVGALRRTSVRHITSEFEAIAFRALCGLHNAEWTVPEGDLKSMAHWLLHSALHHWDAIFQLVGDAWNKEHHPGPFSQLRVDELSPLAKRSPALVKKYGAKQVERVFEQQLALVVQSFGAYVVPGRVGESSVDLICISSEQKVTFLLEAKTSGKPYALPTKDARALKEYVAGVQKALSTLPKLEFVLIVSGSPSSTLGKKIRLLEIDCGVPVRFCSAQELADLREMTIGPVPMDILRDEVLTGPHILPKGRLSQVVQKFQQAQAAHMSFVKSMMDLRRVEVSDSAEHERFPKTHRSLDKRV